MDIVSALQQLRLQILKRKNFLQFFLEIKFNKMAHKKGVGSSKNGRESESKRLGVKIFGGQAAIAGNIIIRQRGTQHHPGNNVGIGKDHTLFALTDGLVEFRKKKNNRSYVSIVPFETAEA